MKPEQVQNGKRYRLSAAVARHLRIQIQEVQVSRRDSVWTFRCYFDDGSSESIAACDLLPIPAPCSPLDVGPL